eukprot:TRINITY_DN9318_c0_g1_i15.p1 TRINITY_DN9318_c0_g1~~TRINITY_DN9318_c0_g1_i15.p1  ORF type:complete len:539 (+),score=42.74 TRINITY_DN9318_c0_g1_i15:34-1650(+)
MFYGKTEIIFDGDISQNPRCPHGPTVLFQDEVQGGRKRQYYACAAYRDKKVCDFHLDREEKITQGKKFKWEQKLKEFMEGKDDHPKTYSFYKAFLATGKTNGKFCQHCGKILVHPESLTQCISLRHLVTEFSAGQLKKPVSLLKAKTENKKEAQYFFTEESTKYLLDCIRSTESTHVLCIGCPTIFQNLPKSTNKLLLDLDHRYQGLLSPDEFVWYNMMNFHCFHPQGETILRNFISSALRENGGSRQRFVVVLDPPFGGRPELIQSGTLQPLQDLARKCSQDLARKCSQDLAGNWEEDLTAKFNLGVFWIFPYFQEKKIQAVNGDLKMAKYRVNYTNHKEYSGSEEGRKYGSPIRFFTNVELSSLPTPEEFGYKHCTHCNHFVASIDQHCDICNVCPSKDGRPYVHCPVCHRCVKSTYNHCHVCHRCHLPQESCPYTQAGDMSSEKCHANKDITIKNETSKEKKGCKRKFSVENGTNSTKCPIKNGTNHNKCPVQNGTKLKKSHYHSKKHMKRGIENIFRVSEINFKKSKKRKFQNS